jgi:hypothetical protein
MLKAELLKHLEGYAEDEEICVFDLLQLEGFFHLHSLHRDDLEDLGYDTSKASDSDMEYLAQKFSDNGFLEDLEMFLDNVGNHFNISRKSEGEAA